jgi:hypothetical protein
VATGVMCVGNLTIGAKKMMLQKQATKSTYKAVLDDSTFKLLQDIHDGNEPHDRLAISAINSKSATLYLARELNFLQAVASVSGHDLTSQLLYNLHIELLKNSIAEPKSTIVQ